MSSNSISAASATAGAEVVHAGFLCDLCPESVHHEITGDRYKCLNCTPSFDLCGGCFLKHVQTPGGGISHAHVGHTFVRLQR